MRITPIQQPEAEPGGATWGREGEWEAMVVVMRRKVEESRALTTNTRVREREREREREGQWGRNGRDGG
jgi:hypothetical protein